jgi:hypothetical protein
MGYVVPELASHPSCPETRHFPSLVRNSHPRCVEDISIPCQYRDLSRKQPPLSTLPSQSAASTLQSLPRCLSPPIICETISTTIHQNLLRSFDASISCSSMPVSPSLDIRATRCGKALLSRLTAMGSHFTISNYSGGQAMRSTSISMNEDSEAVELIM